MGYHLLSSEIIFDPIPKLKKLLTIHGPRELPKQLRNPKTKTIETFCS
jgi:hypothetical protein